MKVVMFGWELPPIISGGLGTACKGIAEGICSENIDLTFIIPGSSSIKADIDSRVRVISAENHLKNLISRTDYTAGFTRQVSPYHTSVESSGDILLNLTEGSIISFSSNYNLDIFNQIKYYTLMGNEVFKYDDFDLIHAHDWMTFHAGIAAKKKSGKPLIVHLHSTEYDRSADNPNRQIIMIEKEGFDAADRIITVSHYTKNIIISKYNIAPDKIDVVHNAVNRELLVNRYQITRPLKEKIVLFLGRITSQKGPDYFLDAAVKVLNKRNNIRFVMGGNGDLLPRMIKRMADLEIADRFHFTGFLNGIEVEKIYAMSDLYVMPSVSEPFGISPFEALLYDVPVIISKQTGASEILRHAVTVDFWDTEKLADTIITILENSEIREKAVNQCKEDMKNMCWANAGKKIADIYHKTAASSV